MAETMQKESTPPPAEPENEQDKPVPVSTISRVLSSIGRIVRKRSFQVITLFILLWLIYNANSRMSGGSDCYAGRFLPVNLVLYGSYHYDNLTFLRDNNGKGGMPGGQVLKREGTPSDGHLITYYPTLIPTLLVPFYYIPFGLFDISPQSYWPFYMDKWFMSAFVAGAAVFLFLCLVRVNLKMRWRLLLTISFALGTSVWAISSQAFWQHAPSAFFLAYSLYLLLRLKESEDLIGPVGLATSLAVGARPTNVMWFLLVALYIFIYLIKEKKKWWKISWDFVWAMPVVLFNLWYNNAYFGSPLTSGYDFNPVNRYLPYYLHVKNFAAGFRGLILSTSLGLLPNAPFFLFLFPAFILGRRKRKLPALGIRRILWVFVFLHIALFSCYREWWAGFSFAYRYLTDIMPFMCFLLFPLFTWRPFKKFIWPVYIVLLLWAIAIQFYGAFLWSGSLWFGGYWKNINKHLVVKKELLKKGQLFGEHSVHWSLDPEEHYIGIELKHFRFTWKWFMTPQKMLSDLDPDRRVTYGRYAPIIVTFGEKKH